MTPVSPFMRISQPLTNNLLSPFFNVSVDTSVAAFMKLFIISDSANKLPPDLLAPVTNSPICFVAFPPTQTSLLFTSNSLITKDFGTFVPSIGGWVALIKPQLNRFFFPPFFYKFSNIIGIFPILFYT